MMILAMLMLVGAQDTPAATSSEQPVLRSESFITKGSGPSYPESMRPVIREYNACLAPEGQMPYIEGETSEAAMLKRIEICKAAREAAVLKALTISKKDLDASDPQAEVNAIFDGIDTGRVASARWFDDLQAGRATPPSGASSTSQTKD
jgi:hypothetical protein